MTAHHTPSAPRREPSIIELASRPEVDPCDVACQAMPGYILGDLSKLETAWVHEHTEQCRYCRNILKDFEQIDAALDEGAFAALGLPDPLAGDFDSPAAVESGKTVLHPPSVAETLGLKEARYGFTDSPLGPLMIVTTDNGVCGISYLEHRHRHEVLRQCEERGILALEKQSFVQPVIDQLHEYFANTRSKFFLPIDLHGVTPFTRSVLEAASHIPYGHVVTYGAVAAGIGQSGASRAVGNALGRNPLPIVIPCHRVIKSDGSMGWYTGGPHLKHRLLDLEGVHFAAPVAAASQVALGL